MNDIHFLGVTWAPWITIPFPIQALNLDQENAAEKIKG